MLRYFPVARSTRAAPLARCCCCPTCPSRWASKRLWWRARRRRGARTSSSAPPPSRPLPTTPTTTPRLSSARRTTRLGVKFWSRALSSPPRFLSQSVVIVLTHIHHRRATTQAPIACQARWEVSDPRCTSRCRHPTSSRYREHPVGR